MVIVIKLFLFQFPSTDGETLEVDIETETALWLKLVRTVKNTEESNFNIYYQGKERMLIYGIQTDALCLYAFLCLYSLYLSLSSSFFFSLSLSLFTSKNV